MLCPLPPSSHCHLLSSHNNKYTTIRTVNDPGDSGAQHNAEFHLLELPRDVPPHLLKYLPNLVSPQPPLPTSSNTNQYSYP